MILGAAINLPQVGEVIAEAFLDKFYKMRYWLTTEEKNQGKSVFADANLLLLQDQDTVQIALDDQFE
jgi:hypothetical protein